MKRLGVLLLVILGFSTTLSEVHAQKPATILWARGGGDQGEFLFSSLQYSPYTKTLLTVTVDGEWLSWPIGPVSLPLRNRTGFGGSPYPSVLTKGGRELIAGLTNGAVYAWDLTTDKISFVCGFPAYVQWLAATEDGNLIAMSSYPEGILHVYDRLAKKEIITWANSAGCMSFSPDGKLLLAGSNGSLALIDVVSRKIIRHYNNVVALPAPVAFDPVHPGRFVVQDNDFWEMDTSGRIIQTLAVGTTYSQNSIAYSPSGNQLAVEVGGGMVVVNLETGTTRSVPGHTLPCFIGEDTLATVVGSDLRLISLTDNTILGSLSTSESYGLSTFIPDGSVLLNRMNVVNVATGQLGPLLFSDGFPYRSTSPSSYSFHGSLAAGIQDYPQSGVCFWPSQVDSGLLLDTISDSICNSISAFSPDSSVFAIALETGCNAAFGSNIVEVWSPVDHKLLYRFDGPTYPPNSVIFSHDGSLLAVSAGDSCRIWNIKSGKLISLFAAHPSNPWEMELMSFLPGDTSLLLRGYEIVSIIGASLRYMPSDTRAQIIRLPDGRYLGGFDYYYGQSWQDSVVSFFDFDLGRVTNSTTLVEKSHEWVMVVNPATGDFATGGQDLIYYKSLDPPSASVQASPAESALPLEAYAANGGIKIEHPSERGQVYVYRSDGRCFYFSQVQAGGMRYTTGPLPAGVYFVVFQSESGERRFAKVSLFE